MTMKSRLSFKHPGVLAALCIPLWCAVASATTLSPSASGEIFNDFTVANADTATSTATPFTLTGEFLTNEQFAVFEFDLSSISAPVVSASFKFTGTSVLSAADLAVFGYEGDGVVSLDDLNNTGPNFASFEPITDSGTPVSIDVTGYVQTLAPYSGVFVGFEVWDNTLGSGPGSGATISDASLMLTLVPEPSTLALAGFGVIALAACLWRRKR